MAAILRPTRPAWLAVALMLIVGVAGFIWTLVGMTSFLQRSPGELMFSNPTGGSTLFEALLFFSLPALLQAAVAFSIDRQLPWVRAAAAIVAIVIAATCLVFVVLAVVMLALWINGGTPTTGMMPAGGDFMDLQGLAIFIPIAAILGYLDGRAVLLTLRGLRSASATAAR